MKLIEAGRDAYRKRCLRSDAPEKQVEEAKRIYFAGAKILFDSIMGILDPGTEPTEKDLLVMDSIKNEFDEHLAWLAKGAKEEAQDN